MNKQHTQSEFTTSPSRGEQFPLHYQDQTQSVLQAQLLGETTYRDLIALPGFAPDGTETVSPYKLQAEPDFSPEAINHSALLLAAETLPRDILEKNKLDHTIQDSISYQYPPDLNAIILMARAWDQTRNDQVFNLAGEMIDLIGDRKLRDDIAEALGNAHLTGESFMTHYGLVSSRISPQEEAQLEHENETIALAPHHDISNLSYNPIAEPMGAPQERVARPEDLVVVPAELEGYARARRKERLSKAALESTAAVPTDPELLFRDD